MVPNRKVRGFWDWAASTVPIIIAQRVAQKNEDLKYEGVVNRTT